MTGTKEVSEHFININRLSKLERQHHGDGNKISLLFKYFIAKKEFIMQFSFFYDAE